MGSQMGQFPLSNWNWTEESCKTQHADFTGLEIDRGDSCRMAAEFGGCLNSTAAGCFWTLAGVAGFEGCSGSGSFQIHHLPVTLVGAVPGSAETRGDVGQQWNALGAQLRSCLCCPGRIAWAQNSPQSPTLLICCAFMVKAFSDCHSAEDRESCLTLHHVFLEWALESLFPRWGMRCQCGTWYTVWYFQTWVSFSFLQLCL